MPYVYFQYKTGDEIYVKKCSPGEICPSHAYILLTIATFFRERNVNYYRLSDGSVFDEGSLLSSYDYQTLLLTEKEEISNCLEDALAHL